MSKINEMIKELCPNGVARVSILSCSTYIRGITYNKKQEALFNEPGSHKLFRANNITLGSNCLNFEDVKSVLAEVRVKKEQWLQKEDILICAGSGSKEHIGKVAYIKDDMDYTFGGFMAVIRAKACINSRYLFHTLIGRAFKDYLATALNSTTINNLNIQVMSGYEIPLPPLPIQREIVNILDKFSSLIDNLDETIQLRQKQYEYYREKLLTFKDGECEWKTYGDIGPVRMCKRVLKSQTNTCDDIPFYKIGTFGKEADAFISKELFEEYKNTYNYPRKGDILISAAGTIGRTVVFNGEPAYFQDSNIVWIENNEEIVLNSYLRYYCLIAKWKIQESGGVARLYNENLRATEIPIPPLHRQQEIVATLDKFEAMISNLKQERELRQKQYEYYREKLLTFE